MQIEDAQQMEAAKKNTKQLFATISMSMQKVGISQQMAFKCFDKNNDGIISTKDLYDCLTTDIKMKGLRYNDVELIMIIINNNRSGKMKIADFIKAMSQ